MNINKITKTFVRTEGMMKKYIQHMQEKQTSNVVESNAFLDWKERLVKEFDHWIIIENLFPYDAIAETSHMIITKRKVPFDWRLLTEEEEKEIDLLKETYINDNYDVVWENLPKDQTVTEHFHLHLLVLKREEV